jgi:hypothetical protein
MYHHVKKLMYTVKLRLFVWRRSLRLPWSERPGETVSSSIQYATKSLGLPWPRVVPG